MEVYFAVYDSPIGRLEVIASKYAVHAIRFGDTGLTPSPQCPDTLRACLDQLEGYFNGSLRRFAVNTEQQGTDFQKLVWKKVAAIPFGRTETYAGIARALGNPGTVRAVGNANGRNRIPILVPCHRVIGADDSLTGYAGGLWRKQWLLDHEREAAFGIRKLL